MKGITSFEIQFQIKQDQDISKITIPVFSSKKISSDLEKKKRRGRTSWKGIIFVVLKPYQIHLANPLELTQSRLREKL